MIKEVQQLAAVLALGSLMNDTPAREDKSSYAKSKMPSKKYKKRKKALRAQKKSKSKNRK